MRHTRPVLVGLAVLAVLTLLIPTLRGEPAEGASILGQKTPGTVTDPDRVSVELGVQFSSSSDGTITGLRFYKSPENTGPHFGTLWTGGGQRLATVRFQNETASGWQTALFSKPVPISRHVRYVASYAAPSGAYSADNHGFDSALTSGDLTVPSGGGVYSYQRGGFPDGTWQNSNYYVDVLFQRGQVSTGADVAGGAAPSASSIGTATSTAVASPSASPVTTASESASASATSPATSTAPAGNGASASPLNLPRIPWEGGPAYWDQFAKTRAAGWDKSSFFPVGVWWGGASTNAEVQYDKKAGINTYVLLNESTDYKLLADNNMFFIGGKLNAGFTDSSAQWVGSFLDDEVDGRFTPNEGRAHLQQLSDQNQGSGRFRYANFTQMIASHDMSPSDAQAYVNNYTDAASIDQYFYSIPYCDWRPYRDPYLVSIDLDHCRSASSYGKMVRSLRMRDASDGKLQAPWQFVEIMSPEDPATHDGYHATSGDKVAGATMNSIINEARGIVYFNQVFSGSCGSGNLVRLSMVSPTSCVADSMDGVKRVNTQIHTLAPIINTQSYDYSFGAGLNTMLKADDDSIYVFAMTDGSSDPGSRTFTLPPGVSGSSAEVLFENRSVPISGGKFSDTFSNEYTYHVYKISR